MNIEIMRLKTSLSDSKKKLRSLDTEASGLIILIRTYLNPYEDISNIDMNKVTVSVDRLNVVTVEMKELSEKIKKMESELE